MHGAGALAPDVIGTRASRLQDLCALHFPARRRCEIRAGNKKVSHFFEMSGFKIFRKV